MEARRTGGLYNAPPCTWSLSPPAELKEAPAHALSANAGFVTFGLCFETHHFIMSFICCFHGNICAQLCSYPPPSHRGPEIGSHSLEFINISCIC